MLSLENDEIVFVKLLYILHCTNISWARCKLALRIPGKRAVIFTKNIPQYLDEKRKGIISLTTASNSLNQKGANELTGSMIELLSQFTGAEESLITDATAHHVYGPRDVEWATFDICFLVYSLPIAELHRWNPSQLTVIIYWKQRVTTLSILSPLLNIAIAGIRSISTTCLTNR